MNKIVLISTLSLCLLNTKAQDKKITLSVFIGNNGQLDKTLNDFYWPGHEGTWLDDSHTSNITNIKFGGSFSYAIKENISLRVKFGQYIRRDKYIQDYPNSYWEVDIRHSILNISPAICFSKSLQDFKISTGIELPFNFVGNFVSEHTYKEPVNNLEANGKEELDGGKIIGINSFINIQYRFFNQFSVFTEIGGGLLHANLGERFESTTTYIVPLAPPMVNIIDKTMKKLFFSPPEISFGINYSF